MSFDAIDSLALIPVLVSVIAIFVALTCVELRTLGCPADQR